LFADGTTNIDPQTHRYPDTQTWVEGVTVRCVTLDSKIYELDVDSGVARLVFMPGRPW
jgi:hypothetical protein